MSKLKFKHISLGVDDSIWAAGKADGTIYRLFGDAGFVGWVPDKLGKAEVIAAVDWGNLWCVNKDHEIWHLGNAHSLDTGGTWTQVPTHSGNADARTIAVGGDGSVWYAGLDGSLFRLTTDADLRKANDPAACVIPDVQGSMVAVSWEPEKQGRVVAIAAIDRGNLWCINKNYEIWHLENAEDLDTGGTWTQVPTYSGKPDASRIAVGYDGVFYAQIDGTLIGTVPPGAGVGLGFWRTNSSPGKVDVIAARRQGGLWCLTSDGEPWHTVEGEWKLFTERTPYGNQWTYTVRAGDNLLAIVRREFNLRDPEHTHQINQIVDRIVTQNPGIMRDRIKVGDVLTLNH